MGWVASTSRLLKIIGLFCKRALQKRRYSAKETSNFKEPTNRSHPIPRIVCVYACTRTIQGRYFYLIIRNVVAGVGENRSRTPYIVWVYALRCQVLCAYSCCVCVCIVCVFVLCVCMCVYIYIEAKIKYCECVCCVCVFEIAIKVQ